MTEGRGSARQRWGHRRLARRRFSADDGDGSVIVFRGLLRDLSPTGI
jgi:hypothetical protein